MKRVAPLLSLASFLWLLAPSARASDAFPETMKSQIGLTDVPMCTVCHLTNIGGRDTVTKPFGLTLRNKYSVTLLNVQGLRNGLMQMEANKDDSDKDGIDDISELRAGTDPNVPEGGTAIDEGPQYGCQFAAAPTASRLSLPMGAWIAGLAFAGWRRWRRENRHGQSQLKRSFEGSDVENNIERET